MKMLRSQLKKRDFDKIDPISEIILLKEFCDACNSIGIHEEVALRLFSDFIRKSVSFYLKTDFHNRKGM